MKYRLRREAAENALQQVPGAMKNPRRRKAAENASQHVPGAMKNPRRRKAAENTSRQVPGAMKNTRRGKAMEPAQSQISQTLPKANPGGRNSCHKACWSDSESPESKIVKYDSESIGEFSKDGLIYFKSVFGARRSVVALSCTVDGYVLCCSGTVVDHDPKKTWILTSASLVRKPDTQFEAYDHGIKIEVFLPDEQVVAGSLEMCNLHYNIAIVTIESQEAMFKLPAVELSDPPECYSLQPRPVAALGRDAFSKTFQMRYGMLVRERIELDCKELLVSTCNISMDFVGGPVMDHEKRFIGITYSFEDTALFLPVEIAARCLKYFKKEKTIPWLRIKGQALHTLNLDVLESICCNFSRPPYGVLVDKICDISTEKYGGMEVGDIITELDGVTIYSSAQFTVMFLDKLEVATGTLNLLTVKAVVQRCRDKSTFVALLNVQEVASGEYDKSYQNRWVPWKSIGFGVDLY